MNILTNLVLIGIVLSLITALAWMLTQEPCVAHADRQYECAFRHSK
jgi:hypothetical protein